MEKTFIVFVCLFSSLLLQSQENFNTKKGIAIDGYDVVSYFEGKAEKGSDQFSAVHEGVTFWFTNEAHQMAFQEHPDQYVPQYGGYCAYAMAKNGAKVSINPKTYLITDHKLYLFYNSWGTNTLKKWQEEDPEALKEAADEHWEHQ
ncbi:MAG TPA: YHS domain-containing (seleno)protein [Flavobacteriaceae bacterium]|nr:hypothetical protein [Flavobacteriaceae bacterium]MCB9212078.1 hypothetical protein [Alteromonas sp.]HPF09826.1 YHS domain-containing (seleno)protein [Flavobacteriaceae bacterium]HQU22030.1 YHS domain-containing (seleno)protein [Flavobacteriaceae bacterium]HQU64089.1 YHS domain-containing (seleno)protein [Flavobacteriaceae bacterium]